MDVEQLVGELPHWLEVVHVLPDHVGGVVVETEMVAGDIGEHAAPDGRGVGQIFFRRATRHW